MKLPSVALPRRRALHPVHLSDAANLAECIQRLRVVPPDIVHIPVPKPCLPRQALTLIHGNPALVLGTSTTQVGYIANEMFLSIVLSASIRASAT
jgi:hypothetical protein